MGNGQWSADCRIHRISAGELQIPAVRVVTIKSANLQVQYAAFIGERLGARRQTQGLCGPQHLGVT